MNHGSNSSSSSSSSSFLGEWGAPFSIQFHYNIYGYANMGGKTFILSA